MVCPPERPSNRWKVLLRDDRPISRPIPRFLFGAEQLDGMYPPTNLWQAQKVFFLILTVAKSTPPGGNIAVDYNRGYISTNVSRTPEPGGRVWLRHV